MTAPKTVGLPLADVPKYIKTAEQKPRRLLTKLFYGRISARSRSFDDLSAVVVVQNPRLELGSKVRADWMGDILVFTGGGLFARHRDKKSVLAFNNLYIVDNKAVVECNRHLHAKLSLARHLSDAQLRNLHTASLLTFCNKARSICRKENSPRHEPAMRNQKRQKPSIRSLTYRRTRRRSTLRRPTLAGPLNIWPR